MSDFSQERLLRLFCTAPNAFWRHDIDLSLRSAERMARLAHLAGVKSTFYLMVASNTYNLLSREGEHAIETILEHGHQLGLHCDHRTGDVLDTVSRDWTIVAAAYPGQFTDRISFHMPNPSLLWRDIDGFNSAYAPEWEHRYLADSRRQFGPDKEALVSDSMQINLHPEHWFN